MTIAANLEVVKERIALAAGRSGRNPAEISLVAVSKRMPASFLRTAVDSGQLLFGENYLQEAVEKILVLPQELTWHFIGHLQSNKAKIVAEKFDAVETVDRLKIAYALEQNLTPLDKIMSVYLQVNIGRESQKAGIMPEELLKLAQEVALCEHLQIAGLMAIPPYTPEPEKTRIYFRRLRELAEELQSRNVLRNGLGLSMGMSADFEVAVEEGATLVRVGTAIFGDRN